MSKVCSQIGLKCLYLARIGRPDILWSVNKLARSITNWTKAWPGEWGLQGVGLTGGGGPARVRVCEHPLGLWGGTRRGVKDESTSVWSAWQIPPARRKGGRTGLPKKGKWPPRGTGTTVGMTVLTCPCPSQPCFGGSKGRARVTGKAGENGQHSGEMGGSSPWTRPSAPGCGDTLKALAGDQRPI